MQFKNVQNIYWTSRAEEEYRLSVNIRINQSKCKGAECGICAYICPTNVFSLEGNTLSVKSPEYCKLCCKCIEICPKQAISIEK